MKHASAYNISVGKPEGNKPCRLKSEDNIKMDLNCEQDIWYVKSICVISDLGARKGEY
jgi:hypothetical protein